MTDDPPDLLTDDTDGCWLDYEHQQALAEISKLIARRRHPAATLTAVTIIYDRFFEENGTPK